MQKKINKLRKLSGYFLLLGALLWCSGCTEEQSFSGDEEQKVVNLSMNLATRSGTGDAEIKNARIIAFDSYNGGLVYNERIDNPTSNPVTIQMLSGVRDIYVITNEPAGQSSELDNVRNLIDLKAVRMPIGELKQGDTFITFGQTLRQTVSPGATSSNTVEVLNRRLAIKVDLTVSGKGFAQTDKVSFTNLPDAVPLFEEDYESVQKETVTADLAAGNPSEGYVWSKTATIVLPSYLFTPPSEKNKAAKISFTVGSGQVSAAIGHKVSAGDYTLHRNTIYTLAAEIGPDNLLINAQVKNWDKDETDYPAGGGSFWKAQPKDTRIGLGENAIISTELASSGTSATFKWYYRKQLPDFSFETGEIVSGVTSAGNKSEIALTGNGLDDACEVWCVATVKAPDGKTDRLETDHATFMVMGDWVQPAGTYSPLQNWKAPLNVPLGSTCLLQDDRDKKVYRVKLMADGNWWMIQDLAYGDVSNMADFATNCTRQEITNLIGTGLYGVSTSTDFPTGGHLYNAYAALQFRGTESEGGGSDLLKVYLPSLCPEGWHLPGNVNNLYNREWQIFIDKTKIDLHSNTDITRFSYNDMTAFNAYNIEPDFSHAISFHGGYRVGKSDRFSPVDFLTLGIATGPYGGVFTEVSERNGNNVKLPIRCLRNFK